MKKIAFVIQRYGLEVNGGAEYHCRILAEKLKGIYDIEVLTSCAENYMTWANVYNEGLSTLNGVKVRRFGTLQERNKSQTGLERTLKRRRWYQKLLKFFGLLDSFERVFKLHTNIDELNYEWSKHQGPFVPDLIRYINDNERQFEAFVFFTYLYFPTLYGLKVAPYKSILIPTAHDEPPIYLPAFKSFFKMPKAILYNTHAEKKLINQLFKNSKIYSDVVGVGIDLPLLEPQSVGCQSPVEGEYILYIGRIDQSKGCGLLIDYFMRYKRTSKSTLKLVFIGHAFMDIPVQLDIVHLGFVDEQLKAKVLTEAKALVIPSFFESLSLVTLESMAAGVPVIANQHCEVLKDHILESKAGFLFSDYESFEQALETLISGSVDLETMKISGQNYVRNNYKWDVVVEKIEKAVDYVTR